MPTSDLLAALDERIERLEDVAERWDVPGGSKRLAQRARDKAEGIRVARRLVSAPVPEADHTAGDERAARLVVDLAEHWCAALHPPAPQVNPNAADPRHRVAACFACQRTSARVVEDWLAGWLSATPDTADASTSASEPLSEDVEALAKVLADAQYEWTIGPAHAVLRSDWFAARVAKVRTEVTRAEQ